MEEETIQPIDDPGHPSAAVAEALGEFGELTNPGTGDSVDLDMRQRVNKRRRFGLPAHMGPDFKGCQVKLRQWTDPKLQTFRNKLLLTLRAKYPGLGKEDDLPADAGFELSRQMMIMAIMGIKGRFTVPGGKVYAFDFPKKGQDDILMKQRKFVARFLLVPSDPDVKEPSEEMDFDFLEILMALNKGLRSTKSEDIDSLGETFVFGSTTAVDYSD